MRTAKEMYDAAKETGSGQGMTETWGVKHFEVVAKSLQADEEVLYTFIGLHNYISMSKHDNNYAYAVTNKRIIMGQKKLVGENLQSVSLENINDVTLQKGMAIGTVTIDTIREKFNVGVTKSQAQVISDNIHELVFRAKQISSTPSPAPAAISGADELKKFKELLDAGILTQEEFDAKKKQILGI
jgi:hypothetical protein